jgi:hypothetical protein
MPEFDNEGAGSMFYVTTDLVWDLPEFPAQVRQV